MIIIDQPTIGHRRLLTIIDDRQSFDGPVRNQTSNYSRSSPHLIDHHRPSIIDHHHRSSTMGDVPSPSVDRPLNFHHISEIADHRWPPVADRRPQNVFIDHRRTIINAIRSVADHGLPFNHRQSSITGHQSSITDHRSHIIEHHHAHHHHHQHHSRSPITSLHRSSTNRPPIINHQHKARTVDGRTSTSIDRSSIIACRRLSTIVADQMHCTYWTVWRSNI